jgi:hypothetical protein
VKSLVQKRQEVQKIMKLARILFKYSEDKTNNQRVSTISSRTLLLCFLIWKQFVSKSKCGSNNQILPFYKFVVEFKIKVWDEMFYLIIDF